MLLLYAFSAVVIINAVYFVIFSKFSYATPRQPKSSHNFPVSIIICAKNEAENLRKNIPLWLEQDYPDFEIILINDSSTDDTKEIMESFATSHSIVHTVDIENNEAFWSNKKYSLTLGIKRAMHPRMLFTDADCKPASNQWLKLMTADLSEEKQMVLGYGAYDKQPGFLNSLIRYETLMTAVQYFSFAMRGMPYMGVGRNLAYTSQLFYDNRGFMSHMEVNSGDDDLFVNEVANSENVAVCYHPDAFTYSAPKSKFSEWFRQKRRHITTAHHYKTKHKLLLGLYYLSNLLFWVLATLCLIFQDWKIPLMLILFRILLQYILLGPATQLLQEKKLRIWLPFLELFLVSFQLIIFITNSFSKPKRWK